MDRENIEAAICVVIALCMTVASIYYKELEDSYRPKGPAIPYVYIDEDLIGD